MDINELKKPLNNKHVKERKQGGITLSYIEAWHAIDEANRIFGHDGWSRETVHTMCLASSERKIGNNSGWDVTYSAKVRVTVGNVIREGTGHGNGISQNLGIAHENAEKEAESDAMKRALITFGYPFGLALYDKDKKNVVDDSKAEAWVEAQKTTIASMNDAESLRSWIAANTKSLDRLEETNDTLHQELINVYEDRLTAVK